jgi:hypothetical protein
MTAMKKKWFPNSENLGSQNCRIIHSEPRIAYYKLTLGQGIGSLLGA